jgi:hypothetical protein
MSLDLSRLMELFTEGKFSDAILETERLERLGLVHPAVFVWKGRCLLLSGDADEDELELVDEAYQRALVIDNYYVPALIDLGYFYFRLMGQLQMGWDHSQRALVLLRDQVSDVLNGMLEMLEESQTPTAALDYLNEMKKTFLETAELESKRLELEESKDSRQ